MNLSDQAIAAMEAYSWPGNVRELENKIQRALLMTKNETIEITDLGLESGLSDKDQLEILINEHEGNIAMTARKLGISRQALYRKMEKLGLVVEKKLK